MYLFMLTTTRSLRSFPGIVTRPTNMLNTKYHKKKWKNQPFIMS